MNEPRCKRCRDCKVVQIPCPEDRPGCLVYHCKPCPDCQPEPYDLPRGAD